MQYLVVIHDATDPEAQQRRQTVRPDHLKRAEKYQHDGNLLMGGAMLNDAGEVIGSSVIAQFHTREDLDEWLYKDPYTLGNVWAKFEVHPFRVAPHYEVKPLAPKKD
jgi:uncharacterized protein YciI